MCNHVHVHKDYVDVLHVASLYLPVVRYTGVFAVVNAVRPSVAGKYTVARCVSIAGFCAVIVTSPFTVGLLRLTK